MGTESQRPNGQADKRKTGKERTVLQFAEALYGLYAGEQEGQGLVEYALIIAFIAILVIVALIFLRGQISTLFSRVGNSLQ